MLTLSRDTVRVAVQTALVSLSSYLCGFQLTSLFHGASADTGAMWAVISGILVLQTTAGGTWSSTRIRALGTLVGAITSAVYLSLLPFSAIGMAACILATVLFCYAAHSPDLARTAALTVTVMTLLSSRHETLTPLVGVALRLGEACVGAATALIVAVAWPEPAEPRAAPPEQKR